MCDRTLFTLDKEPRTDQSAHTTEVLHGEPISFIGVTYRNMGEGLITGAEMTQRQLYHQSPHSVGDSSKSWEPRETAQPVDGSTGWTVSFLSASVGLNVFQTAGMRLALLTVFLAAQLPFI